MSAIDPNTSAYALAVQWAVLLDLEGLSVLNDETHVNIDDVTETEAGVFVETEAPMPGAFAFLAEMFNDVVETNYPAWGG